MCNRPNCDWKAPDHRHPGLIESLLMVALVVVMFGAALAPLFRCWPCG